MRKEKNEKMMRSYNRKEKINEMKKLHQKRRKELKKRLGKVALGEKKKSEKMTMKRS